MNARVYLIVSMLISFPMLSWAEEEYWQWTGRLGSKAFCHSGQIVSLLEVSNGKDILTVSRDGMIQLWDTQSEKVARRLFCSPAEVTTDPPRYNLSFSSDGKILRHMLNGTTMASWDWSAGKIQKKLKLSFFVSSPGDPDTRYMISPSNVIFSADGKFAIALHSASTTQGPQMVKWDLSKEKILYRQLLSTNPDDSRGDFVMVDDEKFAWIGVGTKIIKVDIASGEIVQTLSLPEVPEKIDNSYAWSSQWIVPLDKGNRLLVGAPKHPLYIVEPATGKIEWIPGESKEYTHRLFSRTTSPDGEWIAREKGFYNLNTKKTVPYPQGFPLHKQSFWVFSRDGETAYTAINNTLSGWDFRTGKKRFSRNSIRRSALPINRLVIPQGTQTLLAGNIRGEKQTFNDWVEKGQTGYIQAWNLKTKKKVAEFVETKTEWLLDIDPATGDLLRANQTQLKETDPVTFKVTRKWDRPQTSTVEARWGEKKQFLMTQGKQSLKWDLSDASKDKSPTAIPALKKFPEDESGRSFFHPRGVRLGLTTPSPDRNLLFVTHKFEGVRKHKERPSIFVWSLRDFSFVGEVPLPCPQPEWKETNAYLNFSSHFPARLWVVYKPVISPWIRSGKPIYSPKLQLWTRSTAKKSVGKKQIEAWVNDLASGKFATRSKAHNALKTISNDNAQIVISITSNDPEVKMRLVDLTKHYAERAWKFTPGKRIELPAPAMLVADHPDRVHWAAAGQEKIMFGKLVDGLPTLTQTLDFDMKPTSITFAPTGELLIGTGVGTVEIFGMKPEK